MKKKIERVALLGGGVIGAGWAARMLLHDIDVCVFDPSPRAEPRMKEVVENAARAWRNMTLAPPAPRGNLQFAATPAAALEGADFVQESGPERLEIKKELISQACAQTDADVVVASSTSGLLPSEMQSDARHPQRVLVAHPFNPVYLLPLVEIVGGAATTTEARKAAESFYRSIGMHPLQVRKEVDAFLADRMMEALWREALHLVREGAATADELDQAICYGPGLRWSFMGSFLTYRIAGGEGGFRHFMEQFGPSLKWPWTRFDGPDLTEKLLDTLSEQSDAQAGGRAIADLERIRDDCLVSVMQALRANDWASGKVWKQHEEVLYEKSHRRTLEEDTAVGDIPAPLTLHQGIVPPEWVDYNNHMTESRYLQAFGDASDALFRYIGIDRAYHASGRSYYTVETHLNFLKELHAAQPFTIDTQLLATDPKRIHLFHTLRTDNGDPLATTEQLLLHVNTKQNRASPADEKILARLQQILDAHQSLPKPEQAGRAVWAKKAR